jgi:hypothetical protein
VFRIVVLWQFWRKDEPKMRRALFPLFSEGEYMIGNEERKDPACFLVCAFNVSAASKPEFAVKNGKMVQWSVIVICGS